MKKKLKGISIIIMICLMTSCNNKKPTEFVETPLSDGYSMEIPTKFKKTNDGSWELVPHNTYLNINVLNGVTTEINEELKATINYFGSNELYKGQVLVKSEKFENNGFKGVISYYEKDTKGKGLGLVTLKSYIVYAVIQNYTNRILVNSISLSNNINDDLSKSIKSIKTKNTTAKTNISKFDEAKAKKEGYQIFKEDNFIIKCSGKLLLDKLRIEQTKQNGQIDNSRPFHVFVKGVDYYINISDLTYLFNGKSDEELNKYNSQDLTYYQTKFDEMEIKNKRGKFKNFDAVYYQNFQENKLTKALYFHHKMKSYMIQVTSKTNTDALFNEFVNSFELINK